MAERTGRGTLSTGTDLDSCRGLDRRPLGWKLLASPELTRRAWRA